MDSLAGNVLWLSISWRISSIASNILFHFYNFLIDLILIAFKTYCYHYHPWCERAFIYVYVTGAVLLKDIIFSTYIMLRATQWLSFFHTNIQGESAKKCRFGQTLILDPVYNPLNGTVQDDEQLKSLLCFVQPGMRVFEFQGAVERYNQRRNGFRQSCNVSAYCRSVLGVVINSSHWLKSFLCLFLLWWAEREGAGGFCIIRGSDVRKK